MILIQPTPLSLYFRATEQADIQQGYKIPGSGFNNIRKVGRLPKTPFAARMIVETFPKSIMPEEVLRLSKAVDKLPELRKAAEHPSLPVPDSDREWWEHQRTAFWFFAGLQREGFRGAGLFSELGSGKSKVAVGFADAMNVQLGLIVGPKSSRLVWHDQFRIHSKRDYHIILPDMRVPIKERLRRILVRIRQVQKQDAEMAKSGIPPQPILVVVNYDAVWRSPFAEWAMEQNWDLIIADELHRLKSPKSKVSKFMFELGDRASFRLGLTGTPLHNRPKDIWAQYRFLDAGVYGMDYQAFSKRYNSITGDDTAEAELEKEFANKLYSIGYRAKGNLQLPPFNETVIREELIESRAAYKKMEHAVKMGIRNGEITINNALTRLIRLQQVTSGYVYDDDHILHVMGHEKENMFIDFMRDFPQNEPLVVFANFHYDLDNIERITAEFGLKYKEYSGVRDEVQDWRHGRGDVLGVQIRAGAESIDLTRARYCMYYSTGLSWGDYRQSFKRVHRAGQTRPVNYLYLVMADTIDERWHRLLSNRGNIIQALLDDYSKDE